MVDENLSTPDVRLREDPSGKQWVCVTVTQCHFPIHSTNVYWEIRDPNNEIAATGMRDSVRAAHNSALAACKRRWKRNDGTT